MSGICITYPMMHPRLNFATQASVQCLWAGAGWLRANQGQLYRQHGTHRTHLQMFTRCPNLIRKINLTIYTKRFPNFHFSDYLHTFTLTTRFSMFMYLIVLWIILNLSSRLNNCSALQRGVCNWIAEDCTIRFTSTNSKFPQCSTTYIGRMRYSLIV